MRMVIKEKGGMLIWWERPNDVANSVSVSVSLLVCGVAAAYAHIVACLANSLSSAPLSLSVRQEIIARCCLCTSKPLSHKRKAVIATHLFAPHDITTTRIHLVVASNRHPVCSLRFAAVGILHSKLGQEGSS